MPTFDKIFSIFKNDIKEMLESIGVDTTDFDNKYLPPYLLSVENAQDVLAGDIIIAHVMNELHALAHKIEKTKRLKENKELVQKLIFQSLNKAVISSFDLPDLADRANAVILTKAQKTGSFIYDGEYETLEEFLLAKLTTSEHPSQISNAEFLLTKALPVMNRLNISTDEFLSIRGLWNRLRQAVPHWNMVQRAYEKAGKDERKKINSLERKIATRERTLNNSLPETKKYITAKKERLLLVAEKKQLESEMNKEIEEATEKYTNDVMQIVEVVGSDIPTTGYYGIAATLKGSQQSLVGEKRLYPGEVEYTLRVPANVGRAIEIATNFVDWRIV